MKQGQPNSARIYLVVLALLGWFALLTQFYININSKAAALVEIIVRYFSYFTITTNLLVALCSSILAIKSPSTGERFFSRQSVQTAIAVYILIVGLIYNIILRSIWNPQGIQKVVDELLHSVIPIMFLIYWIMYVARYPLKWNAILPWLIYPLIYTVFILIRGTYGGFYPYPFVDVGKLGLQVVLMNALGIVILFIIISLSFIAIGKFISKVNAIEKRI